MVLIRFVIHAWPVAGTVPCCGRPTDALPVRDMLTREPAQVTCRPAVT